MYGLKTKWLRFDYSIIQNIHLESKSFFANALFMLVLFFWDKVDTAWMEGMALKNPDDGKPASFNRTETVDCF